MGKAPRATTTKHVHLNYNKTISMLIGPGSEEWLRLHSPYLGAACYWFGDLYERIPHYFESTVSSVLAQDGVSAATLRRLSQFAKDNPTTKVRLLFLGLPSSCASVVQWPKNVYAFNIQKEEILSYVEAFPKW